MAYAIRAYATNRLPDPAWIGSIPSHWEVKKLKYTIAALESGVSVNATDLPAGNEELGVLKTSCIYTGEFRASENKTVVPEELGRVKCPVREQAIIISRMNTPDLVGASGLVTRPHDNLFLPDRLWQTVFRSEADVAARYVAYFLGTEGFRKQVSLAAEGASSSMQNVAKPDFLAIATTIPPLEEQTQIAKFLDYETAKIDALIEKQQQLIALLKEKRQAVISHAVTKGLNPDAPMRNFGIEWLGEVPAHWQVVPTKRLFSLECHPAPKNNDMELLSIYTHIGVRPRKELEQKGNRASSTDGYWIVKKGDLIVNKLLAWMGAVGYSDYEGVTSPAYDILRKSRSLNPKFYHYLFRLENTGYEFKRWSRGIMDVRLRLYFEELGKIQVPLPSEDEQNKIVAYVEGAEATFDGLATKAEDQIELLQERRGALISAAVTGKIDVRGWKAPESQAEAEVA